MVYSLFNEYPEIDYINSRRLTGEHRFPRRGPVLDIYPMHYPVAAAPGLARLRMFPPIYDTA